MRCMIACLAVCAAMRPKSFGVTGTSSSSPSCTSALILLAPVETDLVVLVRHLLDDGELRDRLDFAGLAGRSRRADLARRADRLAGRRQHGIIDRLQEHFTFDALVALKKIEAC